MHGLMMNMPLLISSLIRHADRYHGDTEIVSRTGRGRHPPLHLPRRAPARAPAGQRARRARGAEQRPRRHAGLERLPPFRDSTTRISGMGAVCHTINPRLFPEQIAYIVNHAEDQYVFFDLTFAPLVEKLAPHCKSVRGWVAMTDRAHMPQAALAEPAVLRGPGQRRSRTTTSGRSSTRTPPRRCATPRARPATPRACSTRTARPSCTPTPPACPMRSNLSARDVVLPVVPMFHVNAWGLPYACALVGAKLVFPGAAARRREPVRAVRSGEGHHVGRRADRLARRCCST